MATNKCTGENKENIQTEEEQETLKELPTTVAITDHKCDEIQLDHLKTKANRNENAHIERMKSSNEIQDAPEITEKIKNQVEIPIEKVQDTRGTTNGGETTDQVQIVKQVAEDDTEEESIEYLTESDISDEEFLEKGKETIKELQELFKQRAAQDRKLNRMKKVLQDLQRIDEDLNRKREAMLRLNVRPRRSQTASSTKARNETKEESQEAVPTVVPTTTVERATKWLETLKKAMDDVENANGDNQKSKSVESGPNKTGKK